MPETVVPLAELAKRAGALAAREIERLEERSRAAELTETDTRRLRELAATVKLLTEAEPPPPPKKFPWWAPTGGDDGGKP